MRRQQVVAAAVATLQQYARAFLAELEAASADTRGRRRAAQCAPTVPRGASLFTLLEAPEPPVQLRRLHSRVHGEHLAASIAVAPSHLPCRNGPFARSAVQLAHCVSLLAGHATSMALPPSDSRAPADTDLSWLAGWQHQHCRASAWVVSWLPTLFGWATQTAWGSKDTHQGWE